MPRRPGKCLLACAGALALAVGGCGGDEPERTIPPEDAAAMTERLDAIETGAEGQNCEVVELNVDSLMDLINNLPAEVGVETKDALREATANAQDLALERCNASQGPTGETGAEETDTDTATEATTSSSTTETDETDTDHTNTNTDQPTGEEPAGDGPSGDAGSAGGGSTGTGTDGGGGGSSGGDADVGGSGELTPPSGGVAPERPR